MKKIIKIAYTTFSEIGLPVLLAFILGYMIAVGMQNDMYKELIRVCPVFTPSNPQ